MNGGAVYDTRPWLVFGEGPTRLKGGAFSEHKDARYTARDVRFTRSKDGRTLYAIALGWPEEPLTLATMRVDAADPGARVELLGHGPVPHAVNDRKQLVIRPPALEPGKRPCDHAFAFKLTGFTVSLHAEARFDGSGALRLEPGRATLEGSQVRTQVNDGKSTRPASTMSSSRPPTPPPGGR